MTGVRCASSAAKPRLGPGSRRPCRSSRTWANRRARPQSARNSWRSPRKQWGPGAFDNDDALDLLDALSGQDTAARRQVLEQIFREAREHPENLNFTLGAAEVVAA